MILRSPGVGARLSFMLGGSVQFPPKFCRPFEYLVVSLFKLHCIQLFSAARAVNILKFKSPFRPYTIPLSKKANLPYRVKAHYSDPLPQPRGGVIQAHFYRLSIFRLRLFALNFFLGEFSIRKAESSSVLF